MPEFGEDAEAELPDGIELVRHLEAFEGPILSEYRGPSGAVYVEKWCAHSRGTSTFLLVRSNHRSIAEFLGGRLSMRALLRETSDKIGFVIAREGRAIASVHVAPLGKLPKA